ncbi:SGNH/GDSL hydrolase family protein, partial [Planctomycetota bacterium]|nr:SGNH/GDSL hydrolase family protein [Planctomycetota bacterium]
ESMRRVAEAEGVPVLEVATALDGRPELFVDQYHFTREGHQLFAMQLANELEPRLRTRAEEVR